MCVCICRLPLQPPPPPTVFVVSARRPANVCVWDDVFSSWKHQEALGLFTGSLKVIGLASAGVPNGTRWGQRSGTGTWAPGGTSVKGKRGECDEKRADGSKRNSSQSSGGRRLRQCVGGLRSAMSILGVDGRSSSSSRAHVRV